MALPPLLREAVSSPGGGRISLVVGAGCSVEQPTGVPLATQCAAEIHRRLLADGVLEDGDCSDPTDLSLVADAVFARRNSQTAVVTQLCDLYDLKLAAPNQGYLIAAAMLCERAISSVVTLNFDLALSTALGMLGAGHLVGVIECPEDLPQQRAINVYYLHRNVNSADPELWVLRTLALREQWKGHWEPIIATRVLAAPVVVFAGLGTPVSVLTESVRLLRSALPATLYQVDPAPIAESRFFPELGIDSTAYINAGWCQFMEELSQRLSEEQISRLEQAVSIKVRDDMLPSENIENLLTRLRSLGLIGFGRLRAHWLLHDKPYCPVEPLVLGLMADLLLALAMVARVSATVAVIVEDGIVEFHRNGRATSVCMVASGRGYRGRPAVEAEVERRRKHYLSRSAPPRWVIVGGTSDPWITVVTPPADIVRGGVSPDTDIVTGEATLPLFRVSDLRADHNLAQQVVP